MCPNSCREHGRGRCVQNSQKAAPGPLSAGAPALEHAPQPLLEDVATSCLAARAAKLAVPGSQATLNFAKEWPYENSEVYSWWINRSTSAVSGLV